MIGFAASPAKAYARRRQTLLRDARFMRARRPSPRANVPYSVTIQAHAAGGLHER